MAKIIPFRAWRYNEAVISDINRKFSPLFDVVNREQLEELYDIPNNSIHISVPKSHDDAVKKWAEWKSKQVVIQDPLPGIYIYYQVFSLFGENRKFTRKGFISMVRLPEAGEDSDIVLHEDTIASSVRERTELLDKTMLNIAPTHGLYQDSDSRLEKLMDEYMEHPLYEYIDYQGAINKLAIVQNKQDILRFLAVLKDKKIYLADGHHRYASSLRFKEMHPEAPETSMINYHLMYLTNMASDDLRILPIHRILRLGEHIPQQEILLTGIRKYFDIREVTKGRSPLFQEVRKMKYGYGMILGDRHFILQLKSEFNPEKDIHLKLPAPVKKLGYTVLHYFLFDRVFGIRYEVQQERDEISYEKDYYLAVKSAMNEKGTIAFITSELDLKQMMDVCETGALMPQKSTYFYPKVVCGLVFASIKDEENNSPFDACFRLAEKA